MHVATPRTPRGTAAPVIHSEDGASHRSGDGSTSNGQPPLWVLIVDDRCVGVIALCFAAVHSSWTTFIHVGNPLNRLCAAP